MMMNSTTVNIHIHLQEEAVLAISTEDQISQFLGLEIIGVNGGHRALLTIIILIE